MNQKRKYKTYSKEFKEEAVPGGYLQLQKQAREQVLASLRQAVNLGWRHLQNELRSYALRHNKHSVQLSDFVQEQALELNDIYRNNKVSG